MHSMDAGIPIFSFTCEESREGLKGDIRALRVI